MKKYTNITAQLLNFLLSFFCPRHKLHRKTAFLTITCTGITQNLSLTTAV